MCSEICCTVLDISYSCTAKKHDGQFTTEVRVLASDLKSPGSSLNGKCRMECGGDSSDQPGYIIYTYIQYIKIHSILKYTVYKSIIKYLYT